MVGPISRRCEGCCQLGIEVKWELSGSRASSFYLTPCRNLHSFAYSEKQPPILPPNSPITLHCSLQNRSSGSLSWDLVSRPGWSSGHVPSSVLRLSRLGPCGCRQDSEDAVNDLQHMLQQLQADVDNLSRASQQLSDELIGHRSELEVTPLVLSSRYLQQLIDFTQGLCSV